MPAGWGMGCVFRRRHGLGLNPKMVCGSQFAKTRLAALRTPRWVPAVALLLPAVAASSISRVAFLAPRPSCQDAWPPRSSENNAQPAWGPAVLWQRWLSLGLTLASCRCGAECWAPAHYRARVEPDSFWV